MLRVNRNVITSSVDYILENLNKLREESEEFNPEILEKKFSDFTLLDLSSFIKIADKSLIFQDLDYTYLFLAFLKSNDISFEIIDEFEYDENKDEYKDFKVIE